jgi:diguanylate cyclase (GGDEF)-like protein
MEAASIRAATGPIETAARNPKAAGRRPTQLIRTLLVEDKPVDAMLIRQLLSRAQGYTFLAESVPSLRQAQARLAQGRLDVVLLDLDLTDSSGTDTFLALSAAHPDTPIVVLTSLLTEDRGIESVRLGAQDYLVKGRLNADGLGRTLSCAIARHRLLASVRGMSLTDEMTGLLNRRGFNTIAAGHLKLGNRTGSRFLLFFIDLDGLKRINDQWGHHEGDRAITRVAEVLTKTFRQSDVVARFGGDEFVVLALDSSGDAGTAIRARLEANMRQARGRDAAGYPLTVSVGGIAFDSRDDLPLPELLRAADEALYREKRLRS